MGCETECNQAATAIGQLNHAAAVLRLGSTFLLHLIDAVKVPKKPQHWVRLNQQSTAGSAWWSLFVERWNGIGILEEYHMGPNVVSDASGSWGWRAYIGNSLQWFQLQWPPAWEATNIAVKELVPIVIAAALWGELWRGTRVQFRSDNQVVVATLSKDLPGTHR